MCGGRQIKTLTFNGTKAEREIEKNREREREREGEIERGKER